MALAIGRRRFHGNRYFGDGAYPHQAPVIVLVDTVTAQMNRLTAPGGSISLVPIQALAITDVKTDICVVRDTVNTLQFWQVTLTNGTLVISKSNDHSRPIFYSDGAILREFVVTNNALTTVVRSDITI